MNAATKVVTGAKCPKQKYGQWAPCMDAHLFEDLLAQARKAKLLQ